MAQTLVKWPCPLNMTCGQGGRGRHATRMAWATCLPIAGSPQIGNQTKRASHGGHRPTLQSHKSTLSSGDSAELRMRVSLTSPYHDRLASMYLGKNECIGEHRCSACAATGECWAGYQERRTAKHCWTTVRSPTTKIELDSRLAIAR